MTCSAAGKGKPTVVRRAAVDSDSDDDDDADEDAFLAAAATAAAAATKAKASAAADEDADEDADEAGETDGAAAKDDMFVAVRRLANSQMPNHRQVRRRKPCL